MPAITNFAVLRWAARRGATTPRQVADLMHVSPGSVRAWRASPSAEAHPRILLIVATIKAGNDPGIIGTPADLAAARDRAGLPILAALAAQLGVSCQTLNSWRRTCQVPACVPPACASLTAQTGRPPA